MPIRIHVIVGFIHREICERMVGYSQGVVRRLNAKIEHITWVPGTLEVPFAVQEVIKKCRPDAIVVFGVLQRGKTKHGEVIAHQVTGKLLDLQLAHRVPMVIAIVGPNATLAHAARKAKYVSEKAIRSVVHMVKLSDELPGKPKTKIR